jgi:hypothetical protein
MLNEWFWKLIIHQIFFKLIDMFQLYIMNLTIQKNLILSIPNEITTFKREKPNIGYICYGLC